MSVIVILISYCSLVEFCEMHYARHGISYIACVHACCCMAFVGRSILCCGFRCGYLPTVCMPSSVRLHGRCD